MLKDLTLFKFGNDFLKHLALIETLWLNYNRLYDTPENLQSCNLSRCSELLASVSIVKAILWPERWRSQHFQSC